MGPPETDLLAAEYGHAAAARALLEAAGRSVPPIANVPNRHLADPDPGGDG